MTKAAILQIETQSQNNQVVVLAHINQKILALENSFVANLLYKNNLKLFKQINKSTKLTGGRLTRLTVLDSVFDYNKSGNLIKKPGKTISEEVSSLVFEDGKFKKSERRRFGKFRKTDIMQGGTGRTSVGKNVLDINDPTDEDIRESILICKTQEIELFRSKGIRTILFRDFLNNQSVVSEVSYSFEFEFESYFEDHVLFTLNKMKKSIKFIRGHLESIKQYRAYNFKTQTWDGKYVTETMRALGINYDTKSLFVNMGNNKLKSSDYAKAANSYHNCTLLVPKDQESLSYEHMVKTLLPTSITNPGKMQILLEKFMRLETIVRKVYYGDRQKLHNIYDKPMVSRKKKYKNSYRVETTELFELKSNKLGYNVFSNVQNGLVTFSQKQYNERANLESAYGGGGSAHFLTPTGLRMGEKVIDVRENLNKISIDDVRKFRLLKAGYAKIYNSTKFPSQVPDNKIISNTLTSFNISISPPTPSAMESKREGEIDPYEDAQNYVGQDSFFITDASGHIIKQSINISQQQQQATINLISDIMPKSLKPTEAITSVAEFSKKNSKYSLAMQNPNIKLDIPPQISSLLGKGTAGGADLLKNRNSSPIIWESQMNVFLIKALIGFEDDEFGFPDLNRPIVKKLDRVTLLKPGNKIAKAYLYEIPEIGWFSDIVPVTIYNNLVYIQG